MFNKRYRGGAGKFFQRLTSLIMITTAGTIFRFKNTFLKFLDP